MASNGGKVQFGVQFKVDKSGLNQMKKGLQDVVNAASKMKSSDPLKKQFDQAAASAKKLTSILDGAWNSKLNQLNLDKVNSGIKQAYGNVQNLRNSLAKAKQTGNQGFATVASQVLNTNNQLLQSNKLLDSMADTMAKTVRYGIASSIFNRITGSIQQAYYYAKDLDRSLTDIRIVTGDSADQMERFAKSANTAAKDLGRSTLDYTKAALSYYQQGLGDEEVAARTEATLKAQNITGIGSEMADYLTAVWNGFNAGAEDAQLYVDKLAAVADSTASNMGQLATAISKVASTANNVGVSADQLNGQIATVIATTRQAPEAVGTAFKTIFARINDIKAGTDEAQISLGNYSGKMADLGINVLDAAGNLRDTGQVIEQIGGKWQNMSREQQIYLAQTMAGQRQYNNLIALFDNWDRYIQSVNTSLQAQGTLNEKNDRYMESLGAHLQQLGTEAERTYDVMFDTDGFKSLVDVAEDLLSIFNDFIKGIGGGATALINLGTIGANVFNKQLTQGLLNFKQNLQTLNINKVAEKLKSQFATNILSQRQASGAYNTVDQQAAMKAAQKQAEIYQKIFTVRKGLTQEAYEELNALQQQAGQLTIKIQKAQNYKQMAEATGYDQQKTLSVIKDEIAVQQKNVNLLDLSKNAIQESLRNQQALTKQQKDSVEALRANDQIMGSMTRYEKGWLTQVIKGTANEWQRQKVIEAIKRIRDGENTSLEQQIQLAETLKYIESGQYENDQKRLEAGDRRVAQLKEQASQTLKARNGMSYLMYGIQGVTAAAGSFAQFMKQGATGAEKANSLMSGIQGGVTSLGGIIGTAFGGPMGGMIGSSLGGIVTSLLKAIPGIEDFFENIFSTTEEKLDKLQEKTKQNTDKALGFSNQKRSLEELSDEFDELARKAGSNGQYISKMTADQQQRYKSIVNQIVELNPSVLQGYTDQGDVIIDNNTALQNTIKLLQEQYEAQMAIVYATEQVEKSANTFKDAEQDREQAKYNLKNDIGLEKDIGGANQQLAAILSSSVGVDLGFEGNSFSVIDYFNNNPYQQLIQAFEKYPPSYSQKLKQIRKEYASELSKAKGDVDLITQANENFYNTIIEIFNNWKNESDEGFSNQINEAYDLFGQRFRSVTSEAVQKIYKDVTETKKELADAVKNTESIYGQALDNFKHDMKGAILYNTDFNDTFKDIKDNLGDLYSDQFGNLITTVINDAIEELDYSKYETAQGYKGDYSDIDQWVADQTNFILEQAFGNINNNSIINTQEALNNLADKLEKGLSPEKYQQEIEKIYNNFLNKNKVIMEMLKNKDSYDAASLLLESLFSDIGLKVGNYINEKTLPSVTNAFEQAQEGIKAALNNSMVRIYGSSNPAQMQPLLDWLFASYDANEIVQVFDAINNGTLILSSESTANLEAFQAVIQQLFNQITKDQIANKISQNFDKIVGIINKLQSGKDINYKEQATLMSVFDLTPEQVSSTQAVLDALKEHIEGLDDPLQRLTALSQIFTDFDTLAEHAKDFGIKEGSDEYQSLWQNILDTELNALGKDQTYLKNWAEARGIILDGTKEKTQQALNALKLTDNLEDLGKLTQDIKEKGLENAKDQILELQTQLQNLTGQHYSADTIIGMLDAIAAAAKDKGQDIQTLQELLDHLFNFKGQDTSALDQFNKNKQRLSNLNTASKTLKDKGNLSDDQIKAIASIESENSALAKIAEQQGRYSQDYLDKLNEIINSQRILNEQKREQLRIDSQENLQKLKDQKQDLENQLSQASQINEKQYKAAQTILSQSKLPSGLGNPFAPSQEDIDKAQEVVDLYQSQDGIKQQILTTEGQIATEQENLIRLSQQDLEVIKDKYKTLEQLQEALSKNQISQNEYNTLRPDILDEQIEALGRTKEQFEDFVEILQQNSQNLAQNQQLAQDMAITQWQMQEALEDLTKNFDDYAEKINNAKDLSEDAKQADIDYLNAISSLKQAMQELLGVDLSNEFLSDAHNLQLMKSAIEGDIQALALLRAEAAKDVVIGLEVSQFDQNNISNLIDNFVNGTDWGSIEVGATLDDTNFIAGLNNMLAEGAARGQDLTNEVNAILQGIGFSSKFTTKPVTVMMKVPVAEWTSEVGENSVTQNASIKTVMAPVTLDAPQLESDGTGTAYKGSRPAANRAISHPSSGGKTGGGKGGGGKGKGGKGNKGSNKKKDLNEDKVQPDSDPYHKVNKQLETLDENLKKITDDREKLTGKNYINNLQQQLEVMKKQVKVQREKMNIARTQRTQAKNFLSKYGAQYDNDGNITNYDSILSKAASAYNKKVDEYNKYTVVDDSKAWDKISKGKSKKWKTDYLKKHKGAEYNISQSFADNMKAGLDSAKKTYDKVSQMIDQYEEAEGIVDAFDEKAKDVAERQIEIKIETFTLKINAKLDKASLEQSWNQFLKDIQQDGGLNDVFEDASMNKKNISSITSRVDTNLQAVKDINRQIQTIRQGGESTLFGKEWIDSNGQRQYVTDEASAYKYLKTKVEDLQKSYKELKAARDAIKQDALKSIEQVANAYDKVNDELEFQNDLLKHQQKLIKLTQGEKAFKALDKQYRKSLNNQKQQAAQAREESQYWYNKMNTIADKNSELYQSYYNNYKQAVQNLNNATQNELQILSDLYKNKVNQIIDDWEQKITNGIGLDAISKQWDYVKERSEEVLDDVNKNYQINAFNAAGEEYLQQAEGNLKAQQAIKKVLAEQNQFLKQKQNITQYDIDRANLLLQIEAKRAQLEDANSAKTKLRLRRDSQGNYSYQYVAEDTGVAKAKKQLEELQNELWNFTKNGVQQAQDNVLDAVQSFEQELADIWDKQYQSDEKRQQALDALYAKYSDKISRYVTEIQQRGGQLTDLGTDFLPLLTGASSEYFQGLTPEEQAEYVDKLSGGILTGGGIQAMLNNFLSRGGFDAWFKELNTKFKENQSQWVAESTAATDNETDVNAQAQAASQSAKVVAQTNLNTAKSFLNQTVEIYNNVCDAVSALTTQYNQLGDAIKDLAKEGEGLSTLYSWYDEQEEAASGKTTQLVNATADQNEAAQNEAIAISSLKNKLASYTDQWSQAVNKGNTYSKKIWPQIMESKAFYDDSLLTKTMKDINENNPLLNILNNLGDYSEYINSGMLNKIKDAFTFTQSEIRMLDPNQIRQAYQQSVQIAASFPNVRSEEEIKNALNSMITKASQYIHDSRYTIK